MIDAVTDVPAPVNETPNNFAPGSSERSALEERLKQLASERRELTVTIGGDHRLGGGEPIDVVQPHRKDAVLGTLNNATSDDVIEAVDAARDAARVGSACRTTTEPRSSSRLPSSSLVRGA